MKKSSGFPFSYSGEYFDKSSNTYYLRARYYSPNTGRFISEDSYWGDKTDPLSLNLYIYCANNPVIFIDPSGYGWLRDFLCGLVDGIADSVSFGQVTSVQDRSFVENDIAYHGGKLISEVVMILAGGKTAAAGAALGLASSPSGVGAVAGAGVAVAGVTVMASAASAAIDDALALGAALSEVSGNGSASSSNNNERSTKEKIDDIENNPEDWEQTNESIVDSTKKGNAGGKSIETEFTKISTNEKIYNHTLTRANGSVIESHYRGISKQIK